MKKELLGSRVFHRRHGSYGTVVAVAFDAGAEEGEFRLLVALEDNSVFGDTAARPELLVGHALVNWKASACSQAPIPRKVRAK